MRNAETGDYVLDKWSKEQSTGLPAIINRTVDAVILALEESLPTAMNHFN
jgi:peptidyl-tRNA hydrolase